MDPMQNGTQVRQVQLVQDQARSPPPRQHSPRAGHHPGRAKQQHLYALLEEVVSPLGTPLQHLVEKPLKLTQHKTRHRPREKNKRNRKDTQGEEEEEESGVVCRARRRRRGRRGRGLGVVVGVKFTLVRPAALDIPDIPTSRMLEPSSSSVGAVEDSWQVVWLSRNYTPSNLGDPGNESGGPSGYSVDRSPGAAPPPTFTCVRPKRGIRLLLELSF
uniref:Uncharacterized protein n=1 Tax=Knipowitschia caucasica TaxID=637954 RepID=A0AAV2IQR3_KNICA